MLVICVESYDVYTNKHILLSVILLFNSACKEKKLPNTVFPV